MLKALFSALRRENPFADMFEQFDQMLEISHWMFEHSVQAVLDQEGENELRNELKRKDKQINQLERETRIQVLEFLSVRPDSDIGLGLVIFHVIKDAERIGDYAKNINEVAMWSPDHLKTETYLEPLKDARRMVNEIFPLVRESFKNDNTEKAVNAIKLAKKVLKQCDRLVEDLVKKTDGIAPGEAVAYALMARFIKRIAGHLKNIATTVVTPLDEIDFSGKLKKRLQKVS